MRKQVLRLFLVGMLVLVILASSVTAGSNRVRFTLCHSYVGADQRAKFMEDIMKQFQEAYPEIEVIEEKIPRDQYQTKLKTLAAAGELPEAFILWPNAMTKEFAEAGLIADINDLLAENPKWRDSFVSAALDEFTVNGKTYSAGLGISVCSIVYYNKALFDRYNLAFPTTYAELKEAIKVFNENNIIPIALGNKPKWPVQSTIFSCLANRMTGSEWLTNVLTKKEGAKFTDPEFIAALNILKELTDLGAFNKDYNSLDNVQMRDYFYRGQAAMMIDGSWALPDIISRAPESLQNQIELGIFPSFPGGKGDPNVMSGVSSTGVVINAKATPEQKAAIKKLILFITDTHAQLEYTKHDIPVSHKGIVVDRQQATPLYIKLVDLIDRHPLVTVYDSALNSEQTEIINNGLQALMVGVMKPEDLAKQLQAAVK